MVSTGGLCGSSMGWLARSSNILGGAQQLSCISPSISVQKTASLRARVRGATPDDDEDAVNRWQPPARV